MLPDAAPQDAFDRLLRLPFVELSDDGLFLHDTVREAVAAHLRSSDPDRSRRYRAAAWRQLRDEVARASSHEIWRYTADLLYIIQNPIVREAFFPSTEHLYSPEAARPADGAAIAEIVARWEPAASVAVLEAWWRREPTAFRVMRDRTGSVVGFHILAELDHLSHALLDIDPVARRCWDHLRRNPVPRGQRVLFNRCWMARDFGEAPSPVAGRLLARRQGPVHGAAARPPPHLLGGQGHRDAGADGRAPRLRRAARRPVRARRPARITRPSSTSARHRSTAGCRC